MHKRYRLIGTVSLIAMMGLAASAQRPRTTSPDPASVDPSKPAPAPQTMKAKYEGGVFGYNKKRSGTLSFDDTNRRLLFRTKEQKALLFIPYDAVTSAFADTQSRQPAAATVAGQIPLIYALPAYFIKTKVQYLTIQYSDPDSKVAGITSFKLENKALVLSALAALADKAALSPRGEIYVKKRDADSK